MSEAKVRTRIRLTLRARRCATCAATLLRGGWSWREGTGADSRYYCDNPRCRFVRAPGRP